MRLHINNCLLTVLAFQLQSLAGVQGEGHPAGQPDAEQQGAGKGDLIGTVLRVEEHVALRADPSLKNFLAGDGLVLLHSICIAKYYIN